MGGGVSCAGPFHLQALYGEVCGFSAWLHRSQGFRFSSIVSYRLLLSYRFTLSFGPSSAFRVSFPSRVVRPPSWALAVFLHRLPSSSFASLHLTTLRSLVKVVLFFVTLATAFPIDELKALSRCFSFVRGDAYLSFVLTFVALCESLLPY